MADYKARNHRLILGHIYSIKSELWASVKSVSNLFALNLLLIKYTESCVHW